MRLKIKIGILFVGAVMMRYNSSGQPVIQQSKTNCPHENIVVHLSHESAFTGEICWFKIYCTSSLFPALELSQIAYIELVGNENTSLIRKKIRLTRGEGMGDFEIPVDLPTGLYYILAYTNWMKNFDEASFFKKGLVIINPNQPSGNLSDSGLYVREQADTAGNKIKGNILDVSPDKKLYSTREQVSLKIKTGGMSGKAITGNFSVSVYRQEPPMVFKSKKDDGTPILHDPENIIFKPDYNGILLSGRLSGPVGALPGKIVTLCMPGPGTDIKSNVTDSLGYFHFLLKPKEGEQDVVIEVPDADSKIDLKEAFWNGFRTPPDNLLFGLDRKALYYLKEKYAHYQLQGNFKMQYYLQNPPVQNPVDSSVFYSKPYQTIEMTSYISLDSLREYFYELVPSIKFTSRKGEFNISVIDRQTSTFIDEKPGVFLDGVRYDDYATIAALPAGEISRMVILPTTYYYKDFTFGGIVDIHTKKSDFNGVKPLPNMTRFLFPMVNSSEWRFSAPIYAVSDTLDRIPDFRYLLHWDPSVKIENTGVTTVHFYTSDVTGSFLVSVVWKTAEGEILQAGYEIIVEQ
jgi:hypothetical protein